MWSKEWIVATYISLQNPSWNFESKSINKPKESKSDIAKSLFKLESILTFAWSTWVFSFTVSSTKSSIWVLLNTGAGSLGFRQMNLDWSLPHLTIWGLNKSLCITILTLSLNRGFLEKLNLTFRKTEADWHRKSKKLLQKKKKRFFLKGFEQLVD